MKWDVTFTDFQSDFLHSRARFPAMVAAWGTGKTMTALAKGCALSAKYPNNLGLVLRKNFTDLKDSTMADFELYTGKKVKVQSKSFTFSNGSKIIFHHADELSGVVQNINLGWFFIEQAEEFDNDEVFEKLGGRLRRQGCFRQGFIISNANGHNWIWRKWINEGSEKYMCSLPYNPPTNIEGIEYDGYASVVQATTYDNALNLPPDFLASLDVKKNTAPSHYRRFVLNSHEDVDDGDRVIPYSKILEAVGRDLRGYDDSATVMGCDIAEFGDDRTQIYILKGLGVVEQMTRSKRPHMETAGEIYALYIEHHVDQIGIDDIGEGAGVRSELRRLLAPGSESKMADQGMSAVEMNKWSAVQSIKAGRLAHDTDRFARLRDEMWWNAKGLFEKDYVSIPNDAQLIEELAAHSYWENSKHQPIIARKKDIKAILGWSPDKADALVMALWLASHTKKQLPVPLGVNSAAQTYDPLEWGL